MENLPQDVIEFHQKLEKTLKERQEQLIVEKKAVLGVRERVTALRRSLREQRKCTEEAASAVLVEMARQREAEAAIARQLRRYPKGQTSRSTAELLAERRIARTTFVDLMLQCKRLELLAGPLGRKSRALTEAMQHLESDLQLLDTQQSSLENMVTTVRNGQQGIREPGSLELGEDEGQGDRETGTLCRALEERWVQQAALLDDHFIRESLEMKVFKTEAQETTKISDFEKDVEERLAHQRCRNTIISDILKKI